MRLSRSVGDGVLERKMGGVSHWPASLIEYVRRVAAEEHVCRNQLLVTAIGKKASAPKTEAYFRERHGRADVAVFDAWLDASRDEPPVEGDEVLKGKG